MADLDFRDIEVDRRADGLPAEFGRGPAIADLQDHRRRRDLAAAHHQPRTEGILGLHGFLGSHARDYRRRSRGGDGRFTILTTIDGATWQKLKGSAANKDEGAFAASGTCVFTRGTREAWFGTGGLGGARVFHSEDGGQTWSIAKTPIRHDSANAGIFSLAFSDGLARSGGGGRLHETGRNPPGTSRSQTTAARPGRAGGTCQAATDRPFGAAMQTFASPPGLRVPISRRTAARAGSSSAAGRLQRDRRIRRGNQRPDRYFNASRAAVAISGSASDARRVSAARAEAFLLARRSYTRVSFSASESSGKRAQGSLGPMGPVVSRSARIQIEPRRAGGSRGQRDFGRRPFEHGARRSHAVGSPAHRNRAGARFRHSQAGGGSGGRTALHRAAQGRRWCSEKCSARGSCHCRRPPAGQPLNRRWSHCRIYARSGNDRSPSRKESSPSQPSSISRIAAPLS